MSTSRPDHLFFHSPTHGSSHSLDHPPSQVLLFAGRRLGTPGLLLARTAEKQPRASCPISSASCRQRRPWSFFVLAWVGYHARRMPATRQPSPLRGTDASFTLRRSSGLYQESQQRHRSSLQPLRIVQRRSRPRRGLKWLTFPQFTTTERGAVADMSTINSSCPTCATPTLWTRPLRETASLSSFTRSHSRSLASRSRFPVFDWDPLLFRTALQHQLRVPCLSKDMQCSQRGQLLNRLCDHAAVCSCAVDRNPPHNAVAHVCWEAVQEAGVHPQKRQAWSSFDQPPTDSRTFPASTGPPKGGYRLENNSTPEMWFRSHLTFALSRPPPWLTHGAQPELGLRRRDVFTEGMVSFAHNEIFFLEWCHLHTMNFFF